MLQRCFNPAFTDSDDGPGHAPTTDNGNSIVTTKPERRKRSHVQYTLSQGGDQNEDLEIPSKKFKALQTTWNCTDQPSETSIYFNERMLELSRITHRAFSARIRYQRLRSHKLDLIKSLLNDEQELVQTHIRGIDLQIGALRNTLEDAGVMEVGNKGCRFDPSDHVDWCESDSSKDGSILCDSDAGESVSVSG
ncbi:hypothetical protein CY34DRAFT_16301 [Suillus luteus UH-Slu-Lm8-n1]|uniref:Uncharacterized protein n=1 Tax=Suillus luteus UH-Slu-Lm8-n1 TaxID=930992 RepID=A0A0D0A4M2_9AGAM|nr:hypothetical protein CY34DRAFT_16301 [Suillus luteus UH-Slu-Lm8-n1]